MFCSSKLNFKIMFDAEKTLASRINTFLFDNSFDLCYDRIDKFNEK